jgi:hypothetical protein
MCDEDVAFGNCNRVRFVLFSLQKVFGLHKMNTHTHTGKESSVYPPICLFASFFCENIEWILIKFNINDREN